MKKEQLTLMTYETPKVEVIEVEVEKGFAGSGNMEDEIWTTKTHLV